MEKHYVNKLELNCDNCGGVMLVDYDNNTAICKYCNSTVILVEDEDVVIAKLTLAQQEKEIEKQKLKFEHAQEERLNKIRKSFLTFLMLVFMAFFVVVAAYAFSESYVVCGIIALVQAVLFLTAWFIRMRLIKGAKHKIHTLVTITAFLCMIPFLFCMDIQYRSYSEYIWPSTGLCELVPQPKCSLGELEKDNDTNFKLMIGKANIDIFNDYVEECKKWGFTIEQNRLHETYSAYNEDGIYLNVHYSDYAKQFYIDIEALPKLKDYFWNTTGIAGMLPKPKSELGLVRTDSDKCLDVLIGEVDMEAYVNYVNECIDAGFNIDSTNYTDFFYAYNSDGYKLSLHLEHGDIMSIYVYLVEDYFD